MQRFHYELCWAENQECKEVVRNSWRETDGRNVAQRVVNRLSVCSRSLQKWNCRNKWLQKKSINEKKIELLRCEAEEELVNWKMRDGIEKELDSLLRYGELYWRQRSRVSWLREGNRNMKFFHAKAISRRRRNRLRGLFDEGGV